jgi:hypothetical protein
MTRALTTNLRPSGDRKQYSSAPAKGRSHRRYRTCPRPTCPPRTTSSPASSRRTESPSLRVAGRQGGEKTLLGYRRSVPDSARTVRIAAAQTPEFLEDVPGALAYLLEATEQAQVSGASLLCFPEGFLQGYLTEDEIARRNALDLFSPQFSNLLNQLPECAPTIVVGLIEAEGDALYNTAVGPWWGATARGTCSDGSGVFDRGRGKTRWCGRACRIGLGAASSRLPVRVALGAA